MELEGKQVKICWNLKVNVLEQSDTLFKKFKNFDEMLIKTASPATDDHIKFLIKPTKVLIRSLDKQFSCVGSFYDINNMHIDHAEEIVKEQQESKSIVDGVPATESIVTIVTTVEEDSSSAVDIAAVKLSEVVKEQEFNTLDNVTKSKVAESVSRDSDSESISSSDIVALKDLLSDSEKRLRDRKMKITSLKISLASMEKKNAEKKLSVQKRDRKIKELEETMKIKDDAYKRFKEMHRSHKKENLRNCQDFLEMKLLELEVELSKKNVSFSKLEEENRSLRKFKSWSRSLEKELAALKKKLHSPLDDKEERSAEEVSKASSNIFGDEIEIEELPDTGNMATDSTDEIEFISSFLAELGDTTNESIDPEVTSPKSKTKAASKSASVSHDPRKSVDTSSDDKVVLKQKAVSVDATRSNQMPASENDVVLINEESFNDTITTLSSDDEINLTRDGEENNLLESMLEDHPTFSKEEVITIQEEALKSFLTLKPFASLCAKSDNIAVNKKRIRQGKEGRYIG